MTDVREPAGAGLRVAADDPRHLRTCLSRFATGVTVVSYAADGEPRGVTVNAFTSVSLEPPLLLVALARTARACAYVGSGPFAINVLRADQVDVAMQFAGRPRNAHIRWQHLDEFDRAPHLIGAVAVFQCRPWQIYDGGDHELHVGQVVSAEHEPGEPLLFTSGVFAMTGLPLLDDVRVVNTWQPATSPWLHHASRIHNSAGSA